VMPRNGKACCGWVRSPAVWGAGGREIEAVRDLGAGPRSASADYVMRGPRLSKILLDKGSVLRWHTGGSACTSNVASANASTTSTQKRPRSTARRGVAGTEAAGPS